MLRLRELRPSLAGTRDCTFASDGFCHPSYSQRRRLARTSRCSTAGRIGSVIPRSGSDPLISPILADLRGLPPIYIQAGRCEVLFDSIQAFMTAPADQGADVTLDAWDDMNHDFQMFGPDAPQSAERVAPHWAGHRTRGCIHSRCCFPTSEPRKPMSPDQQFDFDLYRDRIRIWRQCFRPPAGRKRLPGCGDGNGPPLDAGESPAHQLVASIAGSGGRGSGCAASSTCDSSVMSPFCTAAPSVAGRSPMPAPCCAPPDKVWDSGIMGGIGRLEVGDAAALSRPHRACWASSRTGFSDRPIIF